MPVTVKSISLWRKEVENQVGTLAHTLEPIAKAGTNLRVLRGYRHPGDGTKAAIELYPIAGQKGTAAAAEAGLMSSSIPTLLVEGRQARSGIRHRAGHRWGWGRPDLLCGPGDGAKVFGGAWVETEADAKTAAPLIKKTTASKRK
jgi:hypothetical protein